MAANGATTDSAQISYKPASVELPSFEEISAYHLVDETRLAGGLIERAVFTKDERQRTREIAAQLVHQARSDRHKYAGIDAFMEEYGLSSEEGAILMCIAESLLRIPDTQTADQLIAEKLAEGAWEKHLGQSDSMFVNASTWGLMLTGRIVKLKDATGYDPVNTIKRLIARSGEPVIRQAVRKAVQLLGKQFILGRNIQEALQQSASLEDKGYTFSYDMLGEEALTDKDAQNNFENYMKALTAIGRAAGPLLTEHPDALMRRPGLSIKLSTLHPRFEPGKEERLRYQLLPRFMKLLLLAREQGLAICIDAEEQSRLEPTLGIFADAYCNPALDGWHGLGIAVQAYSKRAIPVLRWLRRLSAMGNKRIPIRLVKGAYWDSEIKWAQEQSLKDYPVFTRKLHTDLSYLACMRLLLSDARAFYPQFATHSAFSLAAGYVAGGNRLYEFQRLHGMGQALYGQVAGAKQFDVPCRIYAPVGSHENLLSFLLRRLLENGSNTSFINRLADDEAPVADIIADPIAWAESERVKAHAEPAKSKQDSQGTNSKSYGLAGTRAPIVKPRAIFQPERETAAALAIDDLAIRESLLKDIANALQTPFEAGPLVCGESTLGPQHGARLTRCPHDRRERFATVCESTAQHIDTALKRAEAVAFSWEVTPASKRAKILEQAASLFERDRARLMASIIRESGKTLASAHEEVRQAVDLLRFYASETRHLFGQPLHLKSPTGETNRHGLRGRGPFLCISPWNSPLAIFTGQIAAALGAGNPVLAKPSQHTSVTAFLATERLIEAGIPADVLHLLPGDGSVGLQLVRDNRIAGIAFTGSTPTARTIQKAIAQRTNSFIPFIAATSSINTMLADSSALPEHVVRDALTSAFADRGMRCSSARVLFVQEEIAPKTFEMLSGAILELDIGDPLVCSTDIGPAITEIEQDRLDAHKLKMHHEGRELADCILPDACHPGSYVTPAAFEIDKLDQIGNETTSQIFGPILHVIKFQHGHLSRVINAINATGYGLTLGLHTRIEAVSQFVSERARVGNIFINRDQVRTNIGVQPTGGEGLSGTGTHSAGPHYMARFATERVQTRDITATGSNLDLLQSTTISPRGEAQ